MKMLTLLIRYICVNVLLIGLVACGTASHSTPETREPITVEQFHQWMDELSNWGGGVMMMRWEQPT